MDDFHRQPWFSIAILAGVIYAVVAIGSSALSAAAASTQMHFFWRLSAFVISAVVFTGHIAYEHFRLRDTARRTAWHTALAVAVGACVLAIAANIHDLGSVTGYRPRMLVALVAWPLITAVPAFVVSLLLATGLNWKQRRP